MPKSWEKEILLQNHYGVASNGKKIGSKTSKDLQLLKTKLQRRYLL
jgi:hypothetical protein